MKIAFLILQNYEFSAEYQRNTTALSRLFHLKTPKLLPKNAYFIAKFLKFADGDAEAPLSVFLFHYKYHFKEAEEFFVSSALIFATQK